MSGKNQVNEMEWSGMESVMGGSTENRGIAHVTDPNFVETVPARAHSTNVRRVRYLVTLLMRITYQSDMPRHADGISKSHKRQFWRKLLQTQMHLSTFPSSQIRFHI